MVLTAVDADAGIADDDSGTIREDVAVAEVMMDGWTDKDQSMGQPTTAAIEVHLQ